MASGDCLLRGIESKNWRREHAPMYVDSQVVDWCSDEGVPEGSSGMFVERWSIANIYRTDGG